MNGIPEASLFLGIIPALIFLYISLKGYEGHYKEKGIFLTFIMGMFLGFIAAIVQSITVNLVIAYIILLAFFDQLFKTMILNIGRLHEKRETTIYGMILGLGFGSSFTPFLIIAISSLGTQDAITLSLVAIGSLGIILFHGATGAYIGYGIYVGKLFKYMLTAVLIQIPFNFLLGIMIYLMINYPSSFNLQLTFVICLIIYGSAVFVYVTKKIMPQILSQRKRKRIKKHNLIISRLR